MAERRMFAKTIVDSDAFLEMPISSQCLYFHLSMRADDEGFINKPKSIMRLIGCKEDDMRVLITRKFVIPFESGVVVIKHWKLHNYIRGDRLHQTKYIDEKSQLELDENDSYRLCQSVDGQLTDSCHTEVRLGKDRLGEVKDKEYFSNAPLNNAFIDYIEMRKNIKAPMTEKAIQLAINKLKKLSDDVAGNINNDVAIEILNNSVMNSWKGLFELKPNKNEPKNGFHNFDQGEDVDYDALLPKAAQPLKARDV